MKEEFAPALTELVPHLIEVIGTDEGQLEPAEDAEQVRNSSFKYTQQTK